MKYIVETSLENAKQHFDKNKQPVVVSYFIDGRSSHPIAPTLEGIVRAILWLLLCEDARFFTFVLPQFQKMKQSLPTPEWKMSVLEGILVNILSRKHGCPLWFFLDGLDEYPKDLLDITDFCNKLADSASQEVRICVSSRPEQEVAYSIGPAVRAQNSVLELEEYTRADIYKFATREIDRLVAHLDNTSRRKLIQNLSTRANGLFMWVKLASRDIVHSCWKEIGPDIDRLLERLNHMPEEVNGLYRGILQKRPERGLLMLGIVAFGKRSFTLREFSFILSAEMPSTEDGGGENLRGNIDHSTGGLLDYSTGRVVFSHETVSSFIHSLLKQEPGSPPLIKANNKLVEACLFLLKSFEEPKVAGHNNKQTRTVNNAHLLRELRSYAIQHWLDHLCSSRAQHTSISLDFKHLPVKNHEIAYWHRAYLARYWEHPALVPNTCHPVATTLAFLLLSAIPLELFSSEWKETRESDTDPFRSLLRNPGEWQRHDLDFLVSVDFAPGYSVSIHAGQMLNTLLGNALCIVCSPKDKCSFGKIKDQNDWIQLFSESPSGTKLFETPIRFRRCSASDFNDMPVPKREVYINQSLLNQIKIVLWNCIQLETAKGPELNHGESDKNDSNQLRFATPLHYAAFNGLDMVIKELHECGANVNYVSKKSHHGTPLIAAIQGVSERRCATLKNTTVQVLLHLGASLSLLGNAGNLGIVTPLNAAVKLYTGYRRQIGLEPEDLMEVIHFFVEEGAHIDPATRAIARSSSELRRLFSETSRSMFSSWASQYSSTPPIPIPSPRNFPRSPRDPVNASIAGLRPPEIMSLTHPRLVQTFTS